MEKSEKKTKKKRVILIIVIVVLVAVAIWCAIYFPRGSWKMHGGTRCYFSPDTYLSGNISECKIWDKTRILYSVVIESGAVRIDFTDKDGNVMRRLDFTETSEGCIEFDNKEPQIWYIHPYALTEDTVASYEDREEYWRTNFELFIEDITSPYRYWKFKKEWEENAKYYDERKKQYEGTQR